jgi:hypothetical protein
MRTRKRGLLHYHEGSIDNICSANVGHHLFLTGFFEKRMFQSHRYDLA